MISQTLTQEVSQLEADLCFALADPTRILILKILRERGLVEAERQGITINYSLADPRLIEALDLLRSVLRDRIAHRATLIEELE